MDFFCEFIKSSGFIVFLSLFVPGLVYVIWQRKKITPADPKLGLIAGLLPMVASVVWAFFFIIIEWPTGYGFDKMQWMSAYKYIHYLTIPIAVPVFANLLWKKTAKSLKWDRFALVGGFLVSVVACENVPVGWTFTFFLIPPALLILCVGFTFLRRSKPDKVIKEPLFCPSSPAK